MKKFKLKSSIQYDIHTGNLTQMLHDLTYLMYEINSLEIKPIRIHECLETQNIILDSLVKIIGTNKNV